MASRIRVVAINSSYLFYFLTFRLIDSMRSTVTMRISNLLFMAHEESWNIINAGHKFQRNRIIYILITTAMRYKDYVDSQFAIAFQWILSHSRRPQRGKSFLHLFFFLLLSHR